MDRAFSSNKPFCIKALGISALIFLFNIQSLSILHSQPFKDSVIQSRQLPLAVQRSYFEVNLGYVGYPFSQEQLKPGYEMESVTIPRPAVRLVLMGLKITPHLNAQLTYMRPIWWVNYKFRNTADNGGELKSRTVWMNVAGLTLQPILPLSNKITLYAEGGLGIVTRHGIKEEEQVVVDDLNFATTALGAGIFYNINKSWALSASYSYAASVKSNDQPPVSYFGTGFRYSLAPFQQERLEKSYQKGYIYPRQWLSFSFSTNSLGYGVNDFFKRIYLFWGGSAEVDHGYVVSYQRNLFNGPKVFSFDLGANFSWWNTNAMDQNIWAVSLYPVFRFNFLRNKYFDPYFFYILGGPTYLSQSYIDGNDTGRRFTFYDALGTGLFFGQKRQYNAELRIAHYSNGNIFPMNCGVKIPLTFSLGYAF